MREREDVKTCGITIHLPPPPRSAKPGNFSVCIIFNFLHGFYYHSFLPVRPAINGSVGAEKIPTKCWSFYLAKSRHAALDSAQAPPVDFLRQAGLEECREREKENTTTQVLPYIALLAPGILGRD